MKNPITLFVSVCIFLICVPCHAGIDVTQTQGEVKVVRGEETHDAKHRMSVLEGDVIATGKKGYVDVAWSSLWGCRVLPKSRMTVTGTRLRDQSVKLDKGGVLFRFRKLPANARFQLNAPVTVASIRGTVFMAKTNDKKDTYAVLEGAIQIDSKTSKSHAKLLSGQAIEVKRDGSLDKVRPLHQDEKIQLAQAKGLKIKSKHVGKY